MATIITSFAQFMPAIFILNMVGILWEMVISAWRGRW